jgi:hypothetical protein
MYFPFLTARGVEKKVLINIFNQDVKNITPIILPYSKFEEEALIDNENYIRIVKVLVEKQKEFISICKPSEVGSLKDDITNFDKYCIYGLYSDDIDEISNEHRFAIIHTTPQIEQIADNSDIVFHIFMPSTLNTPNYIDLYQKDKRVVIEDAFVAERRNADYVRETFFSSQYLTYDKRFAGFGDFTVQSMNYTPATGGDMREVAPAIHLTYLKKDFIFVRHYMTTPMEEVSYQNRVIKTIERALAEKTLFEHTAGMIELESKLGQSTSLAKFKEISMKHHIEFISRLISRKQKNRNA